VRCGIGYSRRAPTLCSPSFCPLAYLLLSTREWCAYAGCSSSAALVHSSSTCLRQIGQQPCQASTVA
jgi:hypothetical protein